MSFWAWRVCRHCWRVKRRWSFVLQDIRRFPMCRDCWRVVAEPVYAAMLRDAAEGARARG